MRGRLVARLLFSHSTVELMNTYLHPSLRPLAFLAALLLLAVATPPTPLHAQPLAVEVAGGGFVTPLGVEVDALGRVWVAEAGSGADDGRITVITPDGVPHPFMTGLRSVPTAEGVGGINQIRLVGDQLWIAHGLSEEVPEGYLYAVDVSGFTPGAPPLTMADVTETIDVGSFVLGGGFAQTNVYDLAFSPDGEIIYLTDSSANAVLAYDRASDALSVVAVLPMLPNPTPIGPPVIQTVPTGIVYHDDAFYVSAFTGFPFVSGLSTVYRIEDGVVTVFRDGLTSITDLTVDPEDQQLVAVTFAEFDLASGFLPGTGALVKLLDDGTNETLAVGLNLTSAVAIAGDDHYVTSLFGLLHRATPLVDLNVTPDEPLASGGNDPIEIGVALTNTTEDAKSVDLTMTIVMPDGSTHTRAARTRTLAPGETFSRTLGLAPPADAAGGFQFVFVAEDASGLVYDRDVVTLDFGGAPVQAAAALPAWLTLDWDRMTTASAETTQAVRLASAYPNPFRSTTTLSVEVLDSTPATLTVYDALGRAVAVLADQVFEAGIHPVRFDAARLPSGLYLVRLTAGTTTQTHRVTVLR